MVVGGVAVTRRRRTRQLLAQLSCEPWMELIRSCSQTDRSSYGAWKARLS